MCRALDAMGLFAYYYDHDDDDGGGGDGGMVRDPDTHCRHIFGSIVVRCEKCASRLSIYVVCFSPYVSNSRTSNLIQTIILSCDSECGYEPTYMPYRVVSCAKDNDNQKSDTSMIYLRTVS